MNKLSNLSQVQRANKLFFHINNNGFAEVTSHFYAFSTVNETNITLHIPNYSDPNKTTIELKISFDKQLVKDNEVVIKRLEVYAKEGFVNEPLIGAKKAKALQDKKDLLAKLQAELAEIPE